jgi:hypothetical protein
MAAVLIGPTTETTTTTTYELNRADCGHQVHRTERKISFLLFRIAVQK